MNKYTLEQRKMIAEYLEHNLLVEWRTFDATREYELATILNTIEDTIKELRALTFGDIKNIVGTRFKVDTNAYRIVRYFSESSTAILDEGADNLHVLQYFSDGVVVEVTNE